MFKKIKTICKYIDLRWLDKTHVSHDFDGCNFIFIDNRFSDFFEQLESFFGKNLFDKKKTVFIVKFYFSNYFNVLKAAERLGVKVVFYKFYRQIPKVDGKVVFYPYNGQSNCRMILNRNACHVFLTHGESNKKASVNRMVRLYDYIIAAGDISCQRYVESDVLNSYDIGSGKVVRVGTYLTAPCFEYAGGNNGDPCLAYLPTWEGGLDEENYSSIAVPGTSLALARTMRALGVNKIIIKCHPNMGGRIKSYKHALSKLTEELLCQGFEVYIDPASSIFLGKDKILKSRVKIGNEGLRIVFGVSDVSASEFMLAAEKIPSIVFVSKKNNIFSPKDYLEIREKSMVTVDGYSGIEDAVKYSLKKDSVEKFFDYAFSCESYLEINNKNDLGDILSFKFFKS